MAEAGSSGLFISGGIPASPSVDSVVKSFSPDERIRSWLIVQRLLSAHPEYGDERGAELSKRPGPAAGYLTSASQWLDDVRSLVNPDNTKKLHGRLVILGLCRLDLALAAYLDDHDLTNALKKELAEPWQSVITGKPSPDVNCREAFLDLLWNAGKFESTASPPRDRGFIGLVSDPSSACHLQDLCFRQDRNTCLTAGYRFNAKEGLSGLLAYFFSDLSAILRGRGDVRGRFAPDPVGDEWQGWLKNPMGQFLKDRHAVATTSLVSFPLDSIIHQLAREDVLGTGERLVLFAELVDVPRNVTFADLGFPEDVLTILERQPERFGIVLAGLPESITIPSRGPYFRTLPPPVPDPAAHGQHFTNDEPVGPDRLNIKTEVDALAETIALKEMKPPLVVGILGGWGWGKSFVLHLLEERLRRIRCHDLPPGDKKDGFPYVGHPYVIRFDAWTYAKQSLWASLMRTILEGLNDQISLEQTLATKLKGSGVKETDAWELLPQMDCGRSLCSSSARKRSD